MIGGIAYISPALGPHALTLRATYTVPATRKAMIEVLTVWLERATVAAPLDVYRAFWRITRATDGDQTDVIQVIERVSNVAGDTRHAEIGANFMLNPNDSIQGYTSDASTGGSAYYMLTLKYTEFDA